jgi:hypothetical protein
MCDTEQTLEPCSLANTGHCADRTIGAFHQACDRRMNPHKVFEVLAAVTALAAAIAWCRAALKPVAKPGLMPYASGDPNHIMYQEMRAAAEQIERGIILKRQAAALTALSALFQCLALLFKFCTRRMRRIRAASLHRQSAWRAQTRPLQLPIDPNAWAHAADYCRPRRSRLSRCWTAPELYEDLRVDP